MKISNETKIGLLTAVGIVVLILGFNFLKGKNLFDKRTRIFAVFSKIEGLTVSNPVTINGLQVGAVAELKELDKNMSNIVVGIDLTKDINIPENSTAVINPSLGGLGTTSIVIELGSSSNYVSDGDTILTIGKDGMLDELKKNLAPSLERLNDVMDSVKLTLGGVNRLFDDATLNNLQQTIANLTSSTASLAVLLNSQTGALAKSLDNVEIFTGGLAANKEKISSVITNMDAVTHQLANANFDSIFQKFGSAVNELNETMAKINSADGSLGLLMNDKRLYNNLENSARSLNVLLDDLRMNPKRYVHFSLFGRKNSSGPLMAPLNDTITID